MSRRTCTALCSLALCGIACVAPARVPAASAGNGEAISATPAAAVAARTRALQYTFDLDAGFKRLRARLCFEGEVPPALVYGSQRCVDFLREPRLLPPSARALPLAAALQTSPLRRLVSDASYIRLPDLPADSCIAYEVDIQAALDHDALMLAYPGEHSLLLSAELFLWRPVKRPGLRASAQFVLPEGMRVNAPWPLQEGRYRLDESAFAFTGHVVFGQFDERRIGVPGSELNAVIMQGWPEPARGLIPDWLAGAGAVVSQPTGAFPVPDAQVIVVPTSPNVFPIHFGHTGRSGGASIVLLLPTDMNREQFRADWIAIHEFSHLLHPFVRREDAWLSEGLATYLQEVLRVRAGLLTAERAWQRLYDGAQLGRGTDQSLQHETRTMAYAGNYQRVYWAGAAIALLADIECRRQTQGRASLDSVLEGLTQRAFERALSAAELLQALDEIAGVAAFRPTAERYLAGGSLPDLSEIYPALGLAPDGKTLQPSAPLGWIRDAIMAEHAVALPLESKSTAR